MNEISRKVAGSGHQHAVPPHLVEPENQALKIVESQFEKGRSSVPISYPQTQWTYVRSGVFEFTVDGVTLRVGQGDLFVIPLNTTHSFTCIQDGLLVNSYSSQNT